MSELILGSRHSGKTTELIKRSATDGTYILTGTKQQARHIFDQAKELGYNIPYPVTWGEFTKGHFQGSSIQKDGLYIDEAQWLLSSILNGIPIKGATWTKDGFVDLDLKEKKMSSDILLSLEHERLEVWKVGSDVCVSYFRADIKDGPMLVSAFGRGRDFESACDDYLSQIRGKTLVFNACSQNRKEVTVLG